MKSVIATKNAPAAIGPYSQAIEIGNTVYCSGQIPIDPTCGDIVATTIETQAEQVMNNISEVLKEAGLTFENVVKTTCFLSDLADFVAFNGVYAKYFPENPPARSCVEVSALPKNAKVEVEVIAVK